MNITPIPSVTSPILSVSVIPTKRLTNMTDQGNLPTITAKVIKNVSLSDLYCEYATSSEPFVIKRIYNQLVVHLGRSFSMASRRLKRDITLKRNT